MRELDIEPTYALSCPLFKLAFWSGYVGRLSVSPRQIACFSEPRNGLAILLVGAGKSYQPVSKRRLSERPSSCNTSVLHGGIQMSDQPCPSREVVGDKRRDY